MTNTNSSAAIIDDLDFDDSQNYKMKRQVTRITSKGSLLL